MATPPGKRWHTREDSGIRLDRELDWWHDDERVEHPKIVELFNVSLHPTEDGRFQLRIGKDDCYVTVQDAAYRVTHLDGGGAAPFSVRLSDRTCEGLDLATVTLGPDGVLACKVKDGRAKARFSRDAQFGFGLWLEEEGGRLFIRSGGQRQELDRLAELGR